MRLADLDPTLIRREERVEAWQRIVGDHETWRDRGCPTEDVTSPREYHVPTASLEEADGVMFQCPACFAANGGGIGTHYVICWKPRVPPDVLPTPGRWDMVGTGLHDLTLRAGSSSVLLDGPCHAHFFVESSEIRMC